MDRPNPIRIILRTALAVVVAVVLPLGVQGCAPAGSPPAAAAPLAPRPVKMAVFIDKSGSVRDNGIDQPMPEDLVPLIDLLGGAGGELAVGGITADSDKPLWRLMVPLPPEAPLPPKKDGNPFELDEQLNEYVGAMNAYRRTLRSWTDDAVESSEVFLESVRPFLEHPAEEKYTDVWKAVGRGNRMLAEPFVGGGQPPERFLVMVTDGEDNVRSEPISLAVPVHVAVVHGAKKIGDLESLDPESFESFGACVRWIVAMVTEAEGG